MCFFSAIYRVLPECPLLILENREEKRQRPSGPPRIVSCSSTGTAWLGGVDLIAGGTWLGVNQFGVVIGVTNRPKQDVPPGVRSRGLLCRYLLGYRSAEAALEEARCQWDHQQFDGFNLLILTPQACFVVEAGDEMTVSELPKSIHIITNGPLNDPHDPRILRARSELETRIKPGGSLTDWLSTAKTTCGLPKDAESPAICLTEPEWGTVSSTIIALTCDSSQVRYLYAPGPPCETGYHDYSPQLQQLLRR